MPSEWLLWQLVDSAFPTGHFAHSWGLESAWQHGEIADRADLGRFLDASLVQAAYGVLPLANAAHRAPDRLAELDALNEAFLTNVVANRASRAQGRTLAATAARVWPSERREAIKAATAASHAHVAPVTGVVFQSLGVPLEATQRVILYGAARGVLSAAVRLGIVGSFHAQQLQFDCARASMSLLGRCAAFDDRDLAQTAPVPDILQGAHDRLYSRLFQS
jgi:urease accessory protein